MESSVRAQPQVQVTVCICCEMSLGVPLGMGSSRGAGPFHCCAHMARAGVSIAAPDPTVACSWAGLGTVHE